MVSVSDNVQHSVMVTLRAFSVACLKSGSLPGEVSS